MNEERNLVGLVSPFLMARRRRWNAILFTRLGGVSHQVSPSWWFECARETDDYFK